MKHSLLQKLSGSWEGKETIEPSKWGEGGIAIARIETNEQLGGKILTQDYSAQRNGTIWLQAHAVFTCNADYTHYSLYWFDSFGFAPAQPAQGIQENDTLIFTRVSERGMTRHIYAFAEDGKYTLRLESSFDGGASWVEVMSGEYTRTGS